jgi:hypothetical protein
MNTQMENYLTDPEGSAVKGAITQFREQVTQQFSKVVKVKVHICGPVVFRMLSEPGLYFAKDPTSPIGVAVILSQQGHLLNMVVANEIKTEHFPKHLEYEGPYIATEIPTVEVDPE